MSAKSKFAHQHLWAKSLSKAFELSVIAICTLMITSLSVSEAKAKKYKRSYENTIRIESRFSPNKFIYAPVRINHRGDKEVRLPNSRWLDCAKNCRWTVQKKYLDFWEYQRNPFGPGYLRFSIYVD